MAKPEDNQAHNQTATDTDSGYNTPIDESQRHTGMYEKTDAKDGAEPESGSSNTGPEGAPNQGTEKR